LQILAYFDIITDVLNGKTNLGSGRKSTLVFYTRIVLNIKQYFERQGKNWQTAKYMRKNGRFTETDFGGA
jgi:hypothetical protein